MAHILAAWCFKCSKKLDTCTRKLCSVTKAQAAVCGKASCVCYTQRLFSGVRWDLEAFIHTSRLEQAVDVHCGVDDVTILEKKGESHG